MMENFYSKILPTAGTLSGLGYFLGRPLPLLTFTISDEGIVLDVVSIWWEIWGPDGIWWILVPANSVVDTLFLVRELSTPLVEAEISSETTSRAWFREIDLVVLREETSLDGSLSGKK